jgi:predicted dehydrogenase
MKMSTASLKMAQIGCGAFAENTDLPNCAKHPDIDCLWCCDVDAGRAAEMASKFGVPKTTTDFNEAINDPEVDCVKIATSHEVHLPIITAAAAAGKHIFCEKPMAMERREGLEIIRIVRKAGIKLCVGYNRTMSPALTALRKRWQEHVENPRHHPWRYVETERKLFPDEMNTQFLARIQDDTLSYRPVHLDPIRGGGQIIGESVHWLDLACWFFAPQVPVEILAWGSTRFSHGINLKFSGGDAATILFNCGGTFDYPKEMYEVTCQGALFRSENFVENTCYGIPGLDTEIFPFWRDPLPEIGSEGGFAGFMKKYNHRVQGLSNSKEGHGTLAIDKGHEALFGGFVASILEDKPTPCDEIAGYRATYLAKLAIESIRNRQPYPIPVDELDFVIV